MSDLMTNTKQQRLWKICGYDSLEKIFEIYVPVGYFSENQVQGLLKALAAKTGLSCEEIVRAYQKRKTKRANSLLEVRRDGPNPRFMCGSNPHFTAGIVMGNAEELNENAAPFGNCE